MQLADQLGQPGLLNSESEHRAFTHDSLCVG
jgi:hypothetical protein